MKSLDQILYTYNFKTINNKILLLGSEFSKNFDFDISINSKLVKGNSVLYTVVYILSLIISIILKLFEVILPSTKMVYFPSQKNIHLVFYYSHKFQFLSHYIKAKNYQ
jgi:hypothetical protein